MSAPRYDLETFAEDVRSVLAANLTAKCAALDAEKNDGITLLVPSSSGYFFQSLDDKTANYNPFILYGIEEISGDGGVSATPMSVSFSVILVLEDVGQDIAAGKRILRYGRALREIFEENFDSFDGGNISVRVESRPPVDVQILNRSEMSRAIGVMLKCELG